MNSANRLHIMFFVLAMTSIALPAEAHAGFLSGFKSGFKRLLGIQDKPAQTYRPQPPPAPAAPSPVVQADPVTETFRAAVEQPQTVQQQVQEQAAAEPVQAQDCDAAGVERRKSALDRSKAEIRTAVNAVDLDKIFAAGRVFTNALNDVRACERKNGQCKTFKQQCIERGGNERSCSEGLAKQQTFCATPCQGPRHLLATGSNAFSVELDLPVYEYMGSGNEGQCKFNEKSLRMIYLNDKGQEIASFRSDRWSLTERAVCEAGGTPPRKTERKFILEGAHADRTVTQCDTDSDQCFEIRQSATQGRSAILVYDTLLKEDGKTDDSGLIGLRGYNIGNDKEGYKHSLDVDVVPGTDDSPDQLKFTYGNGAYVQINSSGIVTGSSLPRSTFKDCRSVKDGKRYLADLDPIPADGSGRVLGSKLGDVTQSTGVRNFRKNASATRSTAGAARGN